MYRQVLADVAHERGWPVHLYHAKTVRAQAARILGAKTAEVLQRPRTLIGPPWTSEHRVALAAAVMAD
jgi:hypothetical protein